jgi:hypothetical protein
MPKAAVWVLVLLSLVVALLCIVEFQRPRDILGFTPDKPAGQLTPLSSAEVVPNALAPVVGRFQIVNPSPSFRGEIRLLDTVAGDSWISCGSANDEEWCVTPKTGDHTMGEKSKQ